LVGEERVAVGREQLALPVGHAGGVQASDPAHDQAGGGAQILVLEGERSVLDLGYLGF
jgi:hypothetical protein